MQRISEIGREWLDYEASKLPPYKIPKATTLPGVLTEICDCKIDLSMEDLALDYRVQCLRTDAPEVADALARMADHIETWEVASDGAYRCPDLGRYRDRLERLSSVIHPLWDGVCAVWLERDYAEGGDSAITTLARIDKILRACRLFELTAKLVPVISSDAYFAAEAAERLERELSTAALDECVTVKPRIVRALRSAAADLNSLVAAAALRGAASLTQKQIAEGAGVSVRTVYNIASDAHIAAKTGGVPYTAEELKAIMATAKTGGTQKPKWSAVAAFLGRVTSRL